MYEHLRCIALRTVKYDDKRSIVTVWSAERGRLGVLVPCGGSTEARRLRAMLQPLGLFECECDIRPGRELFNIKDVRSLAVLPDVSSSPPKIVISIFLAEVMEKVLREAAPDKNMTDFIFQSVISLDAMGSRATANFIIVFLCRLGSFLGIEPNVDDWEKGMYFDMKEGLYRRSQPNSEYWLEPGQAAVAAMVQRLNFHSAGYIKISRDTRRRILDAILDYYTLHFISLDNLKSLPVLRELF